MSVFPLVPVAGRTAAIVTPGALLPVYALPDGTALLFDSGVRPTPALAETLDTAGLRPRAVLCSHLHPDHIANNPDLIARYGAEIYAPAAEIPLLTRWQDAEYPVTALPAAERISVCGVELGLAPTPGHSLAHTAFVTPDGVCYVGDALLSASMLHKSKLPYMEDVDAAMESMAALGATRYDRYICAHHGVLPGAELPALVRENLQKELDLYALLRSLLARPRPLEDLLTAFMRAAGVEKPALWKAGFMRISTRARVDALLRAGEVRLDGDLVSRA